MRGSVREQCVDRRAVPPVRPLEESQVMAWGIRGAGRRLCCSVNTSHGEGAHGVKRHISGSHFLCSGDKIRLRSHSFCRPPDLGVSIMLMVKLYMCQIQGLEECVGGTTALQMCCFGEWGSVENT